VEVLVFVGLVLGLVLGVWLYSKRKADKQHPPYKGPGGGGGGRPGIDVDKV
jgi:hypothetical protein